MKWSLLQCMQECLLILSNVPLLIQQLNVMITPNEMLRMASREGKLDDVRTALENGGTPDTKDSKNGFTALHWASTNGHDSLVSLLLENNAIINSPAKNGMVPLHCAAGNGYERVVSVLLENGASIDAKDRNGATALHEASQCGHKDSVLLLLDQGASVNIQDQNGNTPLHYASRNGHEAIVSLLLEHEAKPGISNCDNKTPLQVAEYATMKICVEIIQNFINEHNQTLFQACRDGDLALGQRALENGANINVKENGCTPLHEASKNKNRMCISFLLQNNANIDAQDDDGNTALHTATV